MRAANAPAQHNGTGADAELAHGDGADSGAKEVSKFVCHARGDETNEVQTYQPRQKVPECFTHFRRPVIGTTPGTSRNQSGGNVNNNAVA